MVSKIILEKITKAMCTVTGVRLWRNTQAVIDWFNGIHVKEKCTFVCFDVVDFYPSITKDLLNEGLALASQYITVTDQKRAIIQHARKSLLFLEGQAWAKKGDNSLFDVTMGL